MGRYAQEREMYTAKKVMVAECVLGILAHASTHVNIHIHIIPKHT